jgi:hypothetical protein
MSSELDMQCDDTNPEKEDFGDKTFKYVVSKNGKSIYGAKLLITIVTTSSKEINEMTFIKRFCSLNC